MLNLNEEEYIEYKNVDDYFTYEKFMVSCIFSVPGGRACQHGRACQRYDERLFQQYFMTQRYLF